MSVMSASSFRPVALVMLELFLIGCLLATRPISCERVFEESSSITVEGHEVAPGHFFSKKNVRGGKLAQQLSESADAAKSQQRGLVSASSSIVAPHQPSQHERLLAGYVLDLEMTFYYQLGFGYTLREPTEEEYEGLRLVTLDYIKTSTETYYNDFADEDFSLQDVYVTLKEMVYDPNALPDSSGLVYPYVVTMDVFLIFDADAFNAIPTKPTYVGIMMREFNLMDYLMLHLGGVTPSSSLFRFTYRVKYGVSYDNPLPGLLVPTTPSPNAPVVAPSMSPEPTPLPPPTVVTTTSLWKYQIGFGVAARQPLDEEYTALAATTQSFLEVKLQEFYNTPDMPVPFLEQVQVKILETDFLDLPSNTPSNSSGAGQTANGDFPIEVIFQIDLVFDSTGQSGGGTPPTSISILDLISDGTLDATEYIQTFLPSIPTPQFNIFTFVPRVLFSTVDNDSSGGTHGSNNHNVVLEGHNMTITILSNWSFGVTNAASFYSPSSQEYDGLLISIEAYLKDLFLFYYVPASSAIDVIFQFDGTIESKLDFTEFDRQSDYPIQTVVESNLTFLRDPQHVMIPESYQVYPAFDNVDMQDFFENYLQHHILESPLYNRRSILRAITNVQYSYDSAFFDVFIPEEYLNPPTMAPTTSDGSLQPSIDTSAADGVVTIDPSWIKMELVTKLRFQINQERPDRQPTDEEYDGLLDEIEEFFKGSFDDHFDSSAVDSAEFMHLEANFVSTLYEPKLDEDGVTVIRDDLSYFPHQTQVQLDLYFTPESILQRDFEYLAILTLFDYGTFIREFVWQAEPSSSIFRGTSQVGYNPYGTR